MCCLSVFILTAISSLAKALQSPNLVVILADDVGFNSVGYHGKNPEALTPHIDQLAAEGTVFTNFHAFYWCSPSRAALLSGRFPHHVYQNVNSVQHVDQGLPLGMTSLASKLESAGYFTMQAGKWDLGFGRNEYLPVHRGFATSLGYLTGAEDHFSQHVCQDGFCLAPDPAGPYSDMWHNEKPASAMNNSGVFGDTLWTDFAVDSIRGLATTQSLFLFLALGASHTPLQAPEESLKLFPESMFADRRVYAAEVHSLDDNVGRVVSVLHEERRWDSTLLVFLSDNGGPLYWNKPEYTGTVWRGGAGSNNYPLRGGKLSVLEGGVRVPFLMAGGALPEPSRGRSVPALTSIADVYTTFCVAAGVAAEDNASSGDPLLPGVDGVDLMPLVTGEKTQVRSALTLALNASLGSRAGGGGGGGGGEDEGGEDGLTSAIIVGDLKLVLGSALFWFDTAPVWPTEDYAWVWGEECCTLSCGGAGCLFNLTADPSETTDLSEAQPEDVSRLAALLAQEARFEADPGPEFPALFYSAMDARGGFVGPFAPDHGVLKEGGKDIKVVTRA